MRSYFITGGTGFIGRELVRQILQRHDTKLITCLTRGNREANSLLQDSRIRYVKGDILEYELPDATHFTDVIHGANETHRIKEQAQERYYHTIIEGTNRVLRWATNKKVPRILLLSSGGVIQDTAYGKAKRESERLAHSYKFGIKIARIYSVMGEEMPLNGQFAIGKFVGQALTGSVEYYESKSVRSYMHIRDAGAWLLRILDEGKELQPYDVAGNEPMTMKQVAGAVTTAFNVPLIKIPPQSHQHYNYAPDLSSAIALGCTQVLSFAQSLELIHAHFRNSAPQ